MTKACFPLYFYDPKRNIGEVHFLINFIGVIFETGNETREKIWSDLVLNKSEEWSKKRVVFVHTAVFERARN